MQQLDPKVIVLFFIRHFLGTVYVLPFWFIAVFIFEKIWEGNLGGMSEDVFLLLLDGAGIIFLSLLVGISYAWSWLTYIHYSYEHRSDGFCITSGAFIKRHTIIPYKDIENVDLLVNPYFVRLFDIYSLNIRLREAALENAIFRKKPTILLPGLPSQTARSLRAELLRYSQINKAKQPAAMGGIIVK